MCFHPFRPQSVELKQKGPNQSQGSILSSFTRCLETVFLKVQWKYLQERCCQSLNQSWWIRITWIQTPRTEKRITKCSYALMPLHIFSIISALTTALSKCVAWWETCSVLHHVTYPHANNRSPDQQKCNWIFVHEYKESLFGLFLLCLHEQFSWYWRQSIESLKWSLLRALCQWQ